MGYLIVGIFCLVVAVILNFTIFKRTKPVNDVPVEGEDSRYFNRIIPRIWNKGKR